MEYGYHERQVVDLYLPQNSDGEVGLILYIHGGGWKAGSKEGTRDIALDYVETYGCAVAAIPCTEGVFETDDGISSCVSTERERLLRTQTPHTYKLGELYGAHLEALSKGITNTAASCMLMKELGRMTYFSKGSEENLKITTPEDLKIFRALLKLR